MNQIIRVTDLKHEYIKRDEDGNIESRYLAVDGVNMEVEKGQFIAILGHNGSGKSTLAKHFNALLFPTEGTVEIAGLDSADKDKLWEIRQKAGMVFQNPDNQIVGTVVDEDVAFGPENLGVPTEEIWQRVSQALEAVGMTAYSTYSPNKLSGGQKQRVAIAGVIAMKPQCIIMDEPTAMLDPNGRREVIETVSELNKRDGITVILITHHMDEAVLADKIFVMDQGQVVMSGTPKGIFSQVERMKELRLDVPQATELAYELRKAGLKLPEDIITNEELVEALCHLF